MGAIIQSKPRIQCSIEILDPMCLNSLLREMCGEWLAIFDSIMRRRNSLLKCHSVVNAVFMFAEELFHGHTSQRFERDAIGIRKRAEKAREN
jgi:hypothetical protein